MVLVAGDVSGGAAFDLADGVRKPVPIGFARAVEVPGAFDLIGGGGHAPDEVVEEAGGVDLVLGIAPAMFWSAGISCGAGRALAASVRPAWSTMLAVARHFLTKMRRFITGLVPTEGRVAVLEGTSQSF